MNEKKKDKFRVRVIKQKILGQEFIYGQEEWMEECKVKKVYIQFKGKNLFILLNVYWEFFFM